MRTMATFQAASRQAAPLLLLLLLLGRSCSAAVPQETAEQVEQEEHWGMAACRAHTEPGKPLARFREACGQCVEDTKGHGDPSRCHQCLRPVHAGNGRTGDHLPEELIGSCLACVPKAEPKRLGWACTSYCSHHHIIMTAEQAEDCAECLYADHPKNKWACHICMEQVTEDMEARRDCYSCLKEGRLDLDCAFCGRVVKESHRAECYACLKGGKTGKECAGRYGVGEFDRNVQFQQDWTQ